MLLMDFVYLVLEIISGTIIYWSLRLMHQRYKRTNTKDDKILFYWAIVGLALYIPVTFVSLTELNLTGPLYHIHNIGVYAFIIIEFSLLVSAFNLAEKNEIDLENKIEEKTSELLSQKLMEHEELNKLRRQHTQELIRGARRLSEQIYDGIDKPLKDSLNFIFLMKQNPDLYETYADSIEAYLEEASKVVSDIEKKTSVGELKIGFEDASELVQKALDAVNVPIGIKVEYEPEFHALAIDPVKMFLVLENLIENAVEEMDNRGVLRVSIDANDDSVKIFISDTGKGISEEDKPNIFTPFFTRKEDGLGLGLVYCRDVVQAHDGTITFETGPDGTTFIVSLPKSSNYIL